MSSGLRTQPRNSVSPRPKVPTHHPCSQMWCGDTRGSPCAICVHRRDVLCDRRCLLGSVGGLPRSPAMRGQRPREASSWPGLQTGLVRSNFFLNLMPTFKNPEIAHEYPVLPLTENGGHVPTRRLCQYWQHPPRAPLHPTPASPDTPRPERWSLSRATEWGPGEPRGSVLAPLQTATVAASSEFPRLQGRGGEGPGLNGSACAQRSERSGPAARPPRTRGAVIVITDAVTATVFAAATFRANATASLPLLSPQSSPSSRFHVHHLRHLRRHHCPLHKLRRHPRDLHHHCHRLPQPRPSHHLTSPWGHLSPTGRAQTPLPAPCPACPGGPQNLASARASPRNLGGCSLGVGAAPRHPRPGDPTTAIRQRRKCDLYSLRANINYGFVAELRRRPPVPHLSDKGMKNSWAGRPCH